MPQIVQPEAGLPGSGANPCLACKQDEGSGQIVGAHRLAEGKNEQVFVGPALAFPRHEYSSRARRVLSCRGTRRSLRVLVFLTRSPSGPGSLNSSPVASERLRPAQAMRPMMVWKVSGVSEPVGGVGTRPRCSIRSREQRPRMVESGALDE